jgi:hypothetical protein
VVVTCRQERELQCSLLQLALAVQRHGAGDTGNEGKLPPIIVALAASYAFPALMVTWVVDLVLGRPLGIDDRNSVNASDIDLFVASTFSINRPTVLPRNRYDAHSTIGDMHCHRIYPCHPSCVNHTCSDATM